MKTQKHISSSLKSKILPYWLANETRGYHLKPARLAVETFRECWTISSSIVTFTAHSYTSVYKYSKRVNVHSCVNILKILL